MEVVIETNYTKERSRHMRHVIGNVFEEATGICPLYGGCELRFTPSELARKGLSKESLIPPCNNLWEKCVFYRKNKKNNRIRIKWGLD